MFNWPAMGQLRPLRPMAVETVPIEGSNFGHPRLMNFSCHKNPTDILVSLEDSILFVSSYLVLVWMDSPHIPGHVWSVSSLELMSDVRKRLQIFVDSISLESNWHWYAKILVLERLSGVIDELNFASMEKNWRLASVTGSEIKIRFVKEISCDFTFLGDGLILGFGIFLLCNSESSAKELIDPSPESTASSETFKISDLTDFKWPIISFSRSIPILSDSSVMGFAKSSKTLTFWSIFDWKCSISKFCVRSFSIFWVCWFHF